MKANELRIGNYLQDEGVVFIVSTNELTYISDNYDHGYKPIRVDEEWLKSLGFQECGLKTLSAYEIHLNGGNMLRMLKGYKRDNYRYRAGVNGYYFECDHIHQLQNLYCALTGKELEIQD